MVIITDLESALKAVSEYLGQDTIFNIKRIGKNAVISKQNTSQYYFVKYDKQPWYHAGYETGEFKGAGMSINADTFSKVEPVNPTILYINSPNTVYEFDIENFRKNSFKHTQKFNGEQVYVISLYQANGVFYI